MKATLTLNLMKMTKWKNNKWLTTVGEHLKMRISFYCLLLLPNSRIGVWLVKLWTLTLWIRAFSATPNQGASSKITTVKTIKSKIPYRSPSLSKMITNLPLLPWRNKASRDKLAIIMCSPITCSQNSSSSSRIVSKNYNSSYLAKLLGGEANRERKHR